MKDRVKYYQSNDVLFGHNFTNIEVIEIPDFNSIDINDALEFYQIGKYIEENTRCKTWSDTDFETYKEKNKQLLSLTKRFFNQIRDENIIELFEKIKSCHHSDFWGLFDGCKLYNKISGTAFKLLLECEKISPHDIFLYSSIVRKYGNILREYILQNDFCISIILHVYEQDYTKKEMLHLPEELTGDDINSFLETYIDSNAPNANYLNAIVTMGHKKPFCVTDELRLKAKRKYDAQINKMSKSGMTMRYGCGVSIREEQIEPVCYIEEERGFGFSYSLTYLMDTLDYPSILNNFIYVFQFVDFPQMRCSHVVHPAESGVFERGFSSESSRMYLENFVFHTKQRMALAQMQLYTEFLLKNDIHLEDVLHWFFTKYLQDEFGCSEIRFSMPSQTGIYSEKCCSIATAYETILKQFSLFAKHGSIDFDLLAMSTTPIVLGNISGLIENKYVYGLGKDYENISEMLFSDQCRFHFVERIYDEGRRYDNFVALLLKEKVYISDYLEEDVKAFEYLASYNLLEICSSGQIILKDIARVVLLKDLFYNDVVNRKHYPLEKQKVFDDFLDKGLIKEGSTLFSKPEINYLNYLLNRSEYVNGLEIRNKYIHGNQQANTDEKEHYQNYLIWLRIIILLAIKINDEFCLRDEIKKGTPLCETLY